MKFYSYRVFYIRWNSFVIITLFELNNYKLGNRKFGEVLLQRCRKKMAEPSCKLRFLTSAPSTTSQPPLTSGANVGGERLLVSLHEKGP